MPCPRSLLHGASASLAPSPEYSVLRGGAVDGRAKAKTGSQKSVMQTRVGDV